MIHGAIYTAWPNVNAVPHYHARSAVSFSVTDTPPRLVFQMADVVGEAVPIGGSQAEFGDMNMLVGSPEMGKSLAHIVEDSPAALLRGHGPVYIAANIRAICLISINMKEKAELILRAFPIGNPQYLSAGEIEKTASMLLSESLLARSWD